MNNKPKLKVLVCSESSKVSSGFGVYNKHLLNALYQHDKYELAEFASYGLIGDKEKHNIPWKYYPNAVGTDDPRASTYNSSAENHFGRWRFDRVVLDFKPDVVIDVRDYWMSSYQGKSPLRKYFHWILMPTVDSYPQQDEWLDTFLDADAIFTYSDWGRDVLLKQTSNKIKYINTTSPGVDLNNFQPILPSTRETKKMLGLDPSAIVIGTVMRNQKRKLFPELIRGFEDTYKKLYSINPERASKLVLYLHTSYPDAGWDIPNLIKNSPIGNKIYMTYSCKNCQSVFASPFAGHRQSCYNCKEKVAIIPNVSNGVDDKILSKIMASFDVYVQYSICEGFGMPQVEAAGCGVPVVTVNYSAMEDIIHKLSATPVEIGAYFKELETSAIRVYPKHEDLVNKLFDLVSCPEQMRKRIGFDTRQKTEQHYTWKATTDKWIDYLDNIKLNGLQGRWDAPRRMINNIDPNHLPKNTSVYETIYLLAREYLGPMGIPLSNYWLLKQIQAAQDGFVAVGPELKPFSIEDILKNINQLINNHNTAEIARTDPNTLDSEDYINYANQQ